MLIADSSSEVETILVGSVSSTSGVDADRSVNSSRPASVALISGIDTELDEIVPERETSVESALVDGVTIGVGIGGGGGGTNGSSRMLTKISPL